MRAEIDHEEEARIRQRGRRHDVLARDVNACEPDRRQSPDDDQERELTIPRAERQRRNLRYRASAIPAAIAIRASQATMRRRRLRRLLARSCRRFASTAAWISAVETTAVSMAGTASTSVSVSSSSRGGGTTFSRVSPSWSSACLFFNDTATTE